MHFRRASLLKEVRQSVKAHSLSIYLDHRKMFNIVKEDYKIHVDGTTIKLKMKPMFPQV